METEIDEDWTSCISKGENRIKNSIYESQIKNSIVRDDKDKFISLLEKSLVVNSRDMVKLKFGDFEVCPYKLLAFICRRRAVNCGTALVKGKTDLKLDLNIPFDQGVYLLHEAASSLSLRLVELFLHHGARANVQCSAVDSEHNGLLPLHVALERVRYDERLAQWTPRKSIFKLIIMLCLPKMKEALETNRLLLYNTYGFKEVVRYFVKGGKLIELAVLLMVAREIVMDPLDCQNITPFTRRMGCITLQQSIQLELVILEIFERAGGAIEAYLQLDRTNVPEKQVAEEVAGLLADAGFKLKSRDYDLSNIVLRCPNKQVLEHSSDLVEEGKSQTEVPGQCGSNHQDVRAVFSRPNKKPTYFVTDDNWRLIHTRLSRGSSALSSSFRPLHVSWNRNRSLDLIWTANFCSGSDKTMGNQVKERIKEVQYVRKFSPGKQWASFVSVVKRGIRFG